MKTVMEAEPDTRQIDVEISKLPGGNLMLELDITSWAKILCTHLSTFRKRNPPTRTSFLMGLGGHLFSRC